LEVFQTTSVEEFNSIFRIIQINMKISMDGMFRYSTDQILQIAEVSYRELQELGKWNVEKAPSGFNVVCHQCGQDGHISPNCPNRKKSNGDRNAKRTPPADGESETKLFNGTTFYWCAKCHRWTKSHGTSKHTGGQRGGGYNNQKQPHTDDEGDAVTDLSASFAAQMRLALQPDF
jgi:hypothetical protein